VIVCGDACWRTVGDEMFKRLVRGGFALAWFDRTEVAADQSRARSTYGAIAAWAWAYHRVADAITQMSDLAATPLIYSGFSRGGKAALLAGALDDRAWLTHSVNSGTLGAGSLQVRSQGSETWQQLVHAFPHWVGQTLRDRAEDPESRLEFDQDSLLQAIAPRRLLITQATQDAWANPTGTAHVVDALRKDRQARGLPVDHIVYVCREGGHAIDDRDWMALMQCASAA
jgi:hypothetical protein